jgi:hypothetical protein
MFYGAKGMMVQPHTRNAQNTRFSGVAILEEVLIDKHKSGCSAEIDTLMASVRSWLREGSGVAEIVRLLAPGYSAITEKYERSGVDLSRAAPRLRIYRNPGARIPWPDYLKSDADEVWGEDESTNTFTKQFDGLDFR